VFARGVLLVVIIVSDQCCVNWLVLQSW